MGLSRGEKALTTPMNMQKPSDNSQRELMKSAGFHEFQDWLKTAKLEDRSLLNAWNAGRHALLHGEVMPPPEKHKNRQWRVVHPRWNKTCTVRGLDHRGEVTPQLTDGDKVIVRVNATGATFPTFFKNLKFVDSGIDHDKGSAGSSKSKAPAKPKTKYPAKASPVTKAILDDIFG
jgi:hypothetical protein